MNGFEFSTNYPQPPIGSTIQSQGNIQNGSTGAQWLRCDSSIINRSQYPVLSNQFGGANGPGTFTPTIRSLVQYTSTLAIASNGTNLVVPCAISSENIQISTNNGVTWTNVITPASANITGQILFTGNNFFACASVSGSYGAIVSPTSSGTGTWTQVSVGNVGASTAACNTSGTIIVPNGSVYFLSTNYGSTFASASPAGAMTIGSPIVWSGTQFVAFATSAGAGVGIQTSPTGLSGSWSATQFVPWGAIPITSAASDGAGNIVAAIGNSSVAWVSNNSGSTWRPAVIPGLVSTGLQALSYANGRWFISLIAISGSTSYANGDVAVSSDTLSWIYVPNFSQGGSTTAVAYAGGNYCALSNQSALSLTTVTENTAQMYLPRSNIGTGGNTTSPVSYGIPSKQEWIRAA